jgi:hypothetical protein
MDKALDCLSLEQRATFGGRDAERATQLIGMDRAPFGELPV